MSCGLHHKAEEVWVLFPVPRWRSWSLARLSSWPKATVNKRWKSGTLHVESVDIATMWRYLPELTAEGEGKGGGREERREGVSMGIWIGGWRELFRGRQTGGRLPRFLARALSTLLSYLDTLLFVQIATVLRFQHWHRKSLFVCETLCFSFYFEC